MPVSVVSPTPDPSIPLLLGIVSVLKLSITGSYFIIAFVIVLRDKKAYIPGDEKHIEIKLYGPGGALHNDILAT
jgi:hypothetical protein